MPEQAPSQPHRPFYKIIGHIFTDCRHNPSFTRVAPAICLLAAGLVWWYGRVDTTLHDYCAGMVDKLLDFAKWAFGAGKAAEELGIMARPKPDPDGGAQ